MSSPSILKIATIQQGIALITALLVVALATLLAVAMTTRQQVDIYRTVNLLHGEQAYLYALSGENWVKRILLRDDNPIDSFNDIWAIPLPPLSIEGGYLQGQIEDLQGRFNLNNLVQEGQPSLEDIRLFERLLQILELSPTLTQVVVDWVDPDQELQQPHGAEDNTYLSQTLPYRAANTLLSTPSEIHVLAGLEHEHYQKLLPVISTLPTRTPININTAPPPILMALADDLTETDIHQLIRDRNKEPFENIQAFLTHEALAGRRIDTQNISVSSAYFLLTTQVQIDRTKIQLTSLLYRWPPTVKVIMRSRGGI